MTTQLFKAKDMKTAMNLVNNEFGEKAIILSTKRNNGVIEVEASDNDEIIEIHKKNTEENKNFSNVFKKEISSSKVNKEKGNISYLGSKSSEKKKSSKGWEFKNTSANSKTNW